MKAVLFVHHPVPPFAPLRELRTAINVDRVHPLNQPGQLTFQLSEEEAQASGFRGTSLREGLAIVDRSTEDIEPWLWFIKRVSSDVRSGYVDVECAEWRQLLFERTVPLSLGAASRSAPWTALSVLSPAGGRNPTYIRPHFDNISGVRNLLDSTQQQDFGGQSLGAAFDQLADQTDTEWWLHYHVHWDSVEPTLHWAYRRGRDRTYFVHVDEGKHIVEGGYTRDNAGANRLIQTIGVGGASTARPAAGQVVGPPISVIKQPMGGRNVRVPEQQRRQAQRSASGGPATTAERISVSPTVTATNSLLGESLRFVILPIAALEQVEATVNQLVRWRDLQLGDTILTRFKATTMRPAVDVPCRIMALQPDEAAGEMLLALEVQAQP